MDQALLDSEIRYQKTQVLIREMANTIIDLRKQLVESVTRNKELTFEMLQMNKTNMEDTFSKFGESMSEMAKITAGMVDAREEVELLIIPLARHYDNDISKALDGGVYIVINDEHFEFGIIVELDAVHEGHFIVKPEVCEGFTMEDWPKEGINTESFDGLIQLVDGLMQELPEVAGEYLLSKYPVSDDEDNHDEDDHNDLSDHDNNE